MNKYFILRVGLTLTLMLALLIMLTLVGHLMNGSTEEFLVGAMASIVVVCSAGYVGLYIWSFKKIK